MVKSISNDMIARLNKVKSVKDIDGELIGFLNAALLRLYTVHYQNLHPELDLLDAIKVARMQLNEAIDDVIIEEAANGIKSVL